MPPVSPPRHRQDDNLPIGFPYLDAVLAAICAAVLILSIMLAPSVDANEPRLPEGKTTSRGIETSAR